MVQNRNKVTIYTENLQSFPLQLLFLWSSIFVLMPACSAEREIVQKRTLLSTGKDYSRDVAAGATGITRDAGNSGDGFSQIGSASNEAPRSSEIILSFLKKPDPKTNQDPVSIEVLASKFISSARCTFDSKPTTCSLIDREESKVITFERQSVSDGVHIFGVIAGDDKGNVSAPLTVTFDMDRTLPALFLPNILSSSIYVSKLPFCPDVQWSSTSEDTTSFELIVDGVKREFSPSITSKNICFDVGSHRVTLTAKDDVGNVSTPIESEFDVKLRFRKVDVNGEIYYEDLKNAMKLTAPISKIPENHLKDTSMLTRYPCPPSYGGLTGWMPAKLNDLKEFSSGGLSEFDPQYPGVPLLGYSEISFSSSTPPPETPVDITISYTDTDGFSMQLGEEPVRYYKTTYLRIGTTNQTFYDFSSQMIACFRP
jgi:hypothetical protein